MLLSLALLKIGTNLLEGKFIATFKNHAIIIAFDFIFLRKVLENHLRKITVNTREKTIIYNEIS